MVMIWQWAAAHFEEQIVNLFVRGGRGPDLGIFGHTCHATITLPPHLVTNNIGRTHGRKIVISFNIRSPSSKYFWKNIKYFEMCPGCVTLTVTVHQYLTWHHPPPGVWLHSGLVLGVTFTLMTGDTNNYNLVSPYHHQVVERQFYILHPTLLLSSHW